jgi:hypothetical protein
MVHTAVDQTDFDLRRQLGGSTSSPAAQLDTHLAEAYTGWTIAR